MENEWEQYGLDKEAWDALTEEEREAYRQVGEESTGEEPEVVSGETAEVEQDV